MVARLQYRAELMPVDQLGDRRSPMANQLRNLFQGHSRIGQHGHERVPELARGPVGWIDPGDKGQGSAEVSADVAREHLGSYRGREHQTGLLPALACRKSVNKLLRSLLP